jgi:branched-chain amino acid transport system ATP-binding protein
MKKILEIEKLTVSFGGLIALNKVDLQVEEKVILGLIGPNGAGKTTLINTISGIYMPEEGNIFYKGGSIIGMKPHQIAQLGIARTFQTLGLFPKMTVLENLLLGLHKQLKGNLFNGSLMTSRVCQAEREGRDKVIRMLSTFGLEEIIHKNPMNLPFGHCKILELIRALLAEPSLLLLDEPTSGLRADEINKIVDIIKKIRSEKGVTILLIEHNISFVRKISDIICVLNFGNKIAEGIPEEVLSNPEVVEAYIGKENTHA